jgi:hypothetical protein
MLKNPSSNYTTADGWDAVKKKMEASEFFGGPISLSTKTQATPKMLPVYHRSEFYDLDICVKLLITKNKNRKHWPARCYN